MKLRAFQTSDLEAVHGLIHRTIDTCYCGLYPPRAVAYFKGYHSRDAICERAAEGLVIVVEDGGVVLATGALLGDEITGVFVAPEHHGLGLGSLVMDELEAAALRAGTTSTRLNVSLPSKGFYEGRGYRISEQLSGDMGEGEHLDYWEAEKKLGDV